MQTWEIPENRILEVDPHTSMDFTYRNLPSLSLQISKKDPLMQLKEAGEEENHDEIASEPSPWWSSIVLGGRFDRYLSYS